MDSIQGSNAGYSEYDSMIKNNHEGDTPINTPTTAKIRDVLLKCISFGRKGSAISQQRPEAKGGGLNGRVSSNSRLSQESKSDSKLSKVINAVRRFTASRKSKNSDDRANNDPNVSKHDYGRAVSSDVERFIKNIENESKMSTASENVAKTDQKETGAPKSMKSSAKNTEKIFQDTLKYITKGADKRVFIPKDNAEIHVLEGVKFKSDSSSKFQIAKKAFYAPVKSFFKNCRKTLLNELAVMKDIDTQISEKLGENVEPFLAVQANVLTGEGKKSTKILVEVERAECDFEDAIKDKSIDFDQRVTFISNFVEGLSQLHVAGYSYGDMKPENALVYKDDKTGEKSLKISDFGKSKKMEAKDEKKYSGNLRFVPPEGKMSFKGDVYSCGLVMVRALEELVLNDEGDSLVEIKTEDRDQFQAKKERRGIENLTTNHKAFPGLDNVTVGDYIFRRAKRQAKLENWGDSKIEQQQLVLNEYLGKLGGELKSETNTKISNVDKRLSEISSRIQSRLVDELTDTDSVSQKEMSIAELKKEREVLKEEIKDLKAKNDQVDGMLDLIGDMLKANPSDRPDAADVSKRFKSMTASSD